MSVPNNKIPASILIIGSGVFGLSTAYALATRPEYSKTQITLLDRAAFPAPDGSSIDSSRIIRADYPSPAYAALMAEGLQVWRGDFGADGRYTQSGLCIAMEDGHDGDGPSYWVEQALATITGALGLKVGARADGGDVTPFTDEATARAAMGSMGGLVGRCGYVNWTSGWAHAEKAMRHLRALVEATGRVQFRTAEAARLLFARAESAAAPSSAAEPTRVAGVELADGSALTAELTLLAAGAWTPRFLDLRGIASATGQALAYIELTEAEQARLGTNPVVLCETNGFFIIPPTDRMLKVARHGYGYANPVEVPHPERSGETITVSLPRTKSDDPNLNVAPEALRDARAFLAMCIPDMADRPWAHTRICWYTDTPEGDFLIDYHPKYEGLFVATGGSGHAYKFLPVIGERIADLIQGCVRDELGAELKQRWQWPTKKFPEDHVWTTDWRGGKKGMVLDDELAKR